MRMISRKRTPFSTGRVLGSILTGFNTTVEDVEASYARAYGVPHAVLLPSCRSGIDWALQSSVASGSRVICSAYNCFVVWESVIRSGGQLHLVDIANKGFLMDESGLSVALTGECSVVLSEIYGYRYDLSKVRSLDSNNPIFRIIDMAMTVPTHQHFERLDNKDFAIISFGFGKCMCAGWGGIGFSYNKKLIDDIKKIRQTVLRQNDFILSLNQNTKLILRNLVTEPFAYGLLRRIKGSNSSFHGKTARDVNFKSLESIAEKPVPKEWTTPTGYSHRNLMLYNLKNVKRDNNHNLRMAMRYHRNFDGVPGVVRPDISDKALSHYPILVSPKVHLLLRIFLDSAGRQLFRFPYFLSKEDYPNTDLAVSRVLELPLGVKFRERDIDSISKKVINAVKFTGK